MSGSGSPPCYELLDHTADVAIRLRGADLAGLFASLAFAMIDLQADAWRVAAREERLVELEAPEGISELVVAFANEILFRIETERLLLPWAEVLLAGPDRVRARLRGEILDPVRHRWKGELKSATYHDLTVAPTEAGGWEATLVVDV